MGAVDRLKLAVTGAVLTLLAGVCGSEELPPAQPPHPTPAPAARQEVSITPASELAPTLTPAATAESLVRTLQAPTPSSTPTATPIARSETRRQEGNRIAFVGLEGQIYTVNPDGSRLRQTSPEKGVFTWPTWSPDARRLVFSRVVEDDGGNYRISLVAFDSANSSVRGCVRRYIRSV